MFSHLGRMILGVVGRGAGSGSECDAPAARGSCAAGVGSVTRLVRLCIALVVLSGMGADAAAKPDRDVLYQVSIIDSLMAGLYDGWVTIGELTKHGDFGVGTFDRLDGEMVVLDGIVYQVTADGIVRRPSAAITTPFAAVTPFDKDATSTIPREMALPALKDYLDKMLPSRNVFCAIRIDGTFPYVRTRSVPSQSKPYPRLATVTKHEPEFEFTNVKGTIVALWCPYYVKGMNVPGYHMHFITADRKRGGHLLDCTIGDGVVTLDATRGLSIVLPNDKDFYHTSLEAGAQESVETVEQGKK